MPTRASPVKAWHPADINGDESIDGRDVQTYVEMLLP